MSLGNCTLIKSIAQGGCAEIFLSKARNTDGLEKYLVCKCLNQSLTDDMAFLHSILQEVRLSVQLRHPNILEIFDLQVEESQAFLTMEYMDALDLQKLQSLCRETHETIPIPIALYIVQKIASGLHAAHELTDKNGNSLHLVHRDVTPENILFNSLGDIKLSDFGIAKTADMPNITPPETIKGKFNYMSPEQAWGDTLDRRSDLFSLAVVLYEAVLGESMYPTDSVDATLSCARVAKFTPPHQINPNFPSDLENILLKALDIDTQQRYQTVSEFSQALDKCIERNHWQISQEYWLKWLANRIPFPSPRLPLMHYAEFPSSKNSLLSIPTITQETPDVDITGKVPLDELVELARLSSERSIQCDLSSLSSVQPTISPSKSTSSLNMVVSRASRPSIAVPQEYLNPAPKAHSDLDNTASESTPLSQPQNVPQPPEKKLNKIFVWKVILVLVGILILAVATLMMHYWGQIM